MISLAAEVFDEFITGTAATWYSAAHLNRALGGPVHLVLVAAVTGASGSSANADVYLDASGDNQTWVVSASPVMQVPLTEGAVVLQSLVPEQPALRIRVRLTGTNPRCRLKIHATGRG